MVPDSRSYYLENQDPIRAPAIFMTRASGSHASAKPGLHFVSSGLSCRVQGSGFRVQGSGFRV